MLINALYMFQQRIQHFINNFIKQGVLYLLNKNKCHFFIVIVTRENPEKHRNLNILNNSPNVIFSGQWW